MLASAADEPLRPGSLTWRVHSDPVFAVAGIRALIMQALHPLAMAAVDQHHSFEDDFWGRMDRTTEYVSTLTFALGRAGPWTAARVRGIHRKLRGIDPERAGIPARPAGPAALGALLRGRFASLSRPPGGRSDHARRC